MHVTATQRLYSKLPTVINCTDDYCFGGSPLPKDIGISKRYIEVNPPTYQQAILLDHDDESFMADLSYEHSHLPIPNIVIENKLNGRAHSIMLLKAPVPKTEKSHKHPIAYCKAVENALTIEYKADPFYNRIWVKNPFSSDFNVHCLRDEPYELGELADKLDLNFRNSTDVKATLALQKKRAQSEGMFLGRNCHLFDMVRHWAYQAVREYRQTNIEIWRDAVMREVKEQNALLGQPLDYNELKGIAKSISRWVWNQDHKAQARFSKVQAHRGKLGNSSPGGQARSAQFEDKREEAKYLRHEAGMSIAKIAERLEVHRNSVSKWIKDE